LWSWQRTPSYFSSVQAFPPTRCMASAASATAAASMKRIGF